MQTQDFEITIGADGKVRVHIKGAKGKQCLALAEFFEQMIGPVTSRELTSEYYEPEPDVSIHLEQKDR